MSKTQWFIAMAVGVFAWIWCEDGRFGWAAGVICVPSFVLLSRVRVKTGKWTERHGAIGATAGILCSLYLLLTAWRQRRELFPRYHDEFMYLLQARLLSAGKLWLPSPANADFFESVYVLVKPVYSALSWPGAAIFFAPGVKLGVPIWITPLVLAGITVGVFLAILRREFALGESLTGVVLLLSLTIFRQHALLSMAQLPTLMLGLVVVYATLRWLEKKSLAWAAVCGMAAGWMAITRPIDCLCYVLPVGLIWLRQIWCGKWKRVVGSVVVAGMAASPFCMIQLAFDKGVTGKYLTAPFNFYCQRDYPQVKFGVGEFDASARPISELPQKQILYEQYIVPFVKRHTPGNFVGDWLGVRLPGTFETTLPHPLLALLIPAGLWIARRRGVFAVLMVFPLILFSVLYAFYTIFLPHYSLSVAASVVVLILFATREMKRSFASVQAFAIPVVAALAIAGLPEISGVKDDAINRPTARAAWRLPEKVMTPSIVMFHFEAGCDVHDEPVYNLAAASPEDASIIRVQDLGRARAMQLFGYYAQRQPEREVYFFNRVDQSLRDLGNVRQLANLDQVRAR